MKVALVHEFLTQLGGAERVLQAFHEIYPEAPVYTLVYDEQKTQGVFANWKIETSLLQKLPHGVNNYKWYLALMPKAITRFDFSGFDLVLSDSSAFAKGIVTHEPTTHISYCHTPTRYLWQSLDEYVSSIPYSNLVRWSVKPYLKYYLKGWDYAAAQRPDYLIANSRTVKERIKEYYDRDAEIIYPPVDTEFFRPLPSSLPISWGGMEEKGALSPGDGERWREVVRKYYFTASRLEPYKKIELVVEAFNKSGLILKVAGEGTQAQSLKRKAQKNIKFLGRVSDEELRTLYRGAKAFVFPALEDAGIMVLEALSCGTPVIGFAKGGTAEFIRDGENGGLFGEQSVEAIVQAVKSFEKLSFDRQSLREYALQFDKEVFKSKILDFISAHKWADYKNL